MNGAAGGRCQPVLFCLIERFPSSGEAPTPDLVTARTGVAKSGVPPPEATLEARIGLVSMAIGFSPLAATKFPTGGHHFSPLVAGISPGSWPSFLPTRGRGGSGQRHHPFAGGRLGEPVAVLPVGDQDMRVMQ